MNVVLGPFSCPFKLWKPGGGRVFEHFGFDAETTDIDEERPYLTPDYIMAPPATAGEVSSSAATT